MQEEIRLDLICQGARYRDVDHAKVREIAKSMEQQGLLQPIGVKPCVCEAYPIAHYRLIFGAHRIVAAKELSWTTISATLFPADLADGMGRLAELHENSARNDLTKTQRDGYLAEAGRLLTEIRENNQIT